MAYLSTYECVELAKTSVFLLHHPSKRPFAKGLALRLTTVCIGSTSGVWLSEGGPHYGRHGSASHFQPARQAGAGGPRWLGGHSRTTYDVGWFELKPSRHLLQLFGFYADKARLSPVSANFRGSRGLCRIRRAGTRSAQNPAMRRPRMRRPRHVR